MPLESTHQLKMTHFYNYILFNFKLNCLRINLQLNIDIYSSIPTYMLLNYILVVFYIKIYDHRFKNDFFLYLSASKSSILNYTLIGLPTKKKSTLIILVR